MKVLLDTHAFLWWITNDERLSSHVRSIISDGDNELLVSSASGWEIVIKAGLGRIHLPDKLESFIAEQLNINGIQSMPIHMSHALHVYNLPYHHRDPFDRMIIAQAQVEDLPILTMDPQIEKYEINVIW